MISYSVKFGVLLSYIAACANANYVPPGFEELKPLILTRLNMQKVLIKILILIKNKYFISNLINSYQLYYLLF